MKDEVQFVSIAYLYTKEELDILKAVRSGRYSKIEITLKNQKVVMIKQSEEKHFDTAARLNEYISKNDYQDITIRSNGGEIKKAVSTVSKKYPNT